MSPEPDTALDEIFVFIAGLLAIFAAVAGNWLVFALAVAACGSRVARIRRKRRRILGSGSG